MKIPTYRIVQEIKKNSGTKYYYIERKIFNKWISLYKFNNLKILFIALLFTIIITCLSFIISLYLTSLLLFNLVSIPYYTSKNDLMYDTENDALYKLRSKIKKYKTKEKIEKKFLAIEIDPNNNLYTRDYTTQEIRKTKLDSLKSMLKI